MRVYPFIRRLSSFIGRGLALSFFLSLLLVLLWAAGNAQGFLDSTQTRLLQALRWTLATSIVAGGWMLVSLVVRVVVERRPLVVRWLLTAAALCASSALLVALRFLQVWLPG